MYPDCDTLSNVPPSGYITARDQNMVESSETEGGKNIASFLFREWTQPLKTWSLTLKSNDFQSYLRRETAASQEKDADNIRKGRCKSFIQWFWELNLYPYE